MKTLNINTEQGFKTEIKAIQFWKFDDYYSANVAVKCGDTGIVLICLYGDENEASVRWPQATLWTDEDRNFQDYIETEFTPADFFRLLEKDTSIENNMHYLEQHGEKMN